MITMYGWMIEAPDGSLIPAYPEKNAHEAWTQLVPHAEHGMSPSEVRRKMKREGYKAVRVQVKKAQEGKDIIIDDIIAECETIVNLDPNLCSRLESLLQKLENAK